MQPQNNLVKHIDNSKKKVLFLGYSKEETTLIDELLKARCDVSHTNKKIKSIAGYDFVVSFGYKHILSKSVIQSSNAPIINLHISYLPWNRGAHPNFWSFYDGTPSGVSIHLVDDGIDTGPIIYQKYVNFCKNEDTFQKTYKKLIFEIELLFTENISKIIANQFKIIPQCSKGTFHTVKDLPKEFKGWDCNISSEIYRLKKYHQERPPLAE